MKQKQRAWFAKLIILLGALMILVKIIQSIRPHKSPTFPAPMVVVQKPERRLITNYVNQTGTVVAYNSVNLVARIPGYLEAIEFVDGTFIKKGKELFVIEPEPYLEKLKEAQASVIAQKALAAYDAAEYKRQQRMYKQNATSLNNVEKWFAKSIQSKAEIDKAVANERIAAINYSYTHVNAPFDGRIGRHLIDVGNLVGQGKATDLATIQQIDPIYVYFNLSELDLIKIRKAAHEHGLKPDDINQISVFVAMQNEQGFPHQGKLDFVNTGLNASTGTMEFRALLHNKDYTLLPGLFVQVRIPISTPQPQLTIPNTAVQYDQIGAYVLTMDKSHHAVIKRLVLGSPQRDVRVVLKGLNSEDDVIVSGTQNATPGHLVHPIASEIH